MTIRSRSPWRVVAILTTLTLLLGVATPALAKKPNANKPPIDVQILGLNDFHGQLEAVPAASTSGARIGNLTSNVCVAPLCVEAGGVEYLASHVRTLRATNPNNTVFVSAGDMIGATPLLSAIFHDEPTIEAFNLMDLDYNGVGNHEFDEGITELLRMQYGDQPGFRYTPATPDGCHPVDFCGDGDPFGGADFDFLAANVTYRDSGETIFPPYAVHNFAGGYKIAFVGMTLEGTPLIVSPDGIASVNFLDEAASVNALVPHLKRRGVEAIVVLLHEGGVVGPGLGGPNTADARLINDCDNPRGALPPIVAAMDDEIDIVVTGHTNWAVNCLIDGKYVTGAASQGRLITDIDARLDWTGDFVPGSITVNNKIITRNVTPAADLTALIAEYNVFAGPIAAEVVGSATGPLTRATAPGGDSVVGRLIADAQLAASDGAVIGLMNPGGIRSEIIDAATITYGEAFAVQPFSNVVTTMDLTGAQIETILEQQWTVQTPPPAVPTLRTQAQILHVSAGFTYTWNALGPAGNRVDPATIMLNGTLLNPASTYRVTMNSFLATGGDDFPVFTQGTNVVGGPDDLLALVDYLGDHPNYVPVTTSRITRQN